MNNLVEAKILKLLFDIPGLSDKANLFDFENSGHTQRTGYIKSIDETLSLIFNIPRIGNKLFAALTEGDPDEFVRIISHIERSDFKLDFKNGHVLRFDDKYMEKIKKIGVVILNYKVSPALSRLGEYIDLGESKLTPYLVLPISANEYAVYKKEGINGLMDYFEATDKDLVSVST